MVVTNSSGIKKPNDLFGEFLLIIVSLIVLGFFIKLSQSDFKNIITVFVDDTFYYLKIAQNITTGRGFTFDGINPTNGFQPLWQIIIVPFFMIFKGNIAPIRAIIIFTGLLHVSTGGLIYASSKNVIGQRWSILFAFLWLTNRQVIQTNLFGMEAALSSFMFMAYIWLLISTSTLKHKISNRIFYLWGLGAGLLALTRVEYSIILIFIGLYLLIISKYTDRLVSRKTLIRLSSLIVGFLTFFGPYLVWNILEFHTLTPISGQAKLFYTFGPNIFHAIATPSFIIESWHQIINYSRWLFDSLFWDFSRQAFAIFPFPHYNLIFWLLIFATLVWNLFSRSYYNIASRYRHLIFYLSFFVITHFAFITIFFKRYAIYDVWYFPIEYLALIFLCVLTLRSTFINDIKQLIKNTKIIKVFISVVLLFFLGLIIKQEVFYFSTYFNRDVNADTNTEIRFYEVSQWLDKNVLDSQIIGAFNSGIVGYFSKHTVINLDGLVNSAQFVKRLQEDHLQTSVETLNITYIADYFSSDPSISGINWAGKNSIPAKKITSLASWPLPDGNTYWVLRYEK